MTDSAEREFIEAIQRKPEWVSPQEFSEYVASRNTEMMFMAKRVCEEADKVAERDATIAALTRKIEELEKGKLNALVAMLKHEGGRGMDHDDERLEAFADDRGREDDTINVAHNLGLLRSTHDVDISSSWMYYVPPPPVPDEGL